MPGIIWESEKITLEPVLSPPHYNELFTLQVGASDVTSGLVFLQAGEDGVLQPVCYFSIKFKPRRIHLSTSEKEALT